MIHINNGSNTIKLPIYSNEIVSQFKLINNLSKVETVYNITDSTSTGLLIIFTLTLTDLTAGEYTYILLDNDNNIMNTGIAILGSYNPTNIEYQSNNEIKIYERGY